MREHLDMCFKVKHSIRPMNYPIITTNDILQNLNNLKAKNAAGLDKKKHEMYKALVKSDKCI